MLTAFRLCGEIDIDGSNQNYGSEDGESSEGGYHEDDRANEGGDDDSFRSIGMNLLYFPILKRMENKKKKDQDEDYDDDEKWALKYLDEDDEANKPDVVLRDYDFRAIRFAI